MLGQHLRWWANNKTTLVQGLVLLEYSFKPLYSQKGSARFDKLFVKAFINLDLFSALYFIIFIMFLKLTLTARGPTLVVRI